MVKASDGIVLFGTNFGELIKPAPGINRLCLSWDTLPGFRDYLATTTYKLLQIFGDTDEKGHLTLFDLRCISLPFSLRIVQAIP